MLLNPGFDRNQYVVPVPEDASEYYDELYKMIRSIGGKQKKSP